MRTHRREQKHAGTIFEKMRSHNKIYSVEMLGKCIPVLPGVFSPKYVSDVAWFAREVPKIVKRGSFLEIGTGTGVIALFVGLHESTSVMATDISAVAVKNAKKTFRLHKVHIPVRRGSVFEPIKKNEKFDVIFWNHPFHSSKKVKSMLERGGHDYQYKSLRAFFEDAKKHLTKNGEVMLGTSKNADLKKIREFSRQYGYLMRLLKQATIPSINRKGIQIDVRIYGFRPIKKLIGGR